MWLAVQLFVASVALRARAPPPRLQAASSFSDSPGWKALRDQLDQLPVFTVANEEGKPLQYEVDGKDMGVFYADIEQAKEELANAKEQFPDKAGIDLIPVGLGGVYVACEDGGAMLVPALEELTKAGLPEGAPTVGQPLPLFACMEMSREGEDGNPVLPLFMSHADCAAAIRQATDQDLEEDDKGPPLEIVGLSLPSVVERLATMSDDTQAFTFVPPKASREHITEYLGTQA